MHNKEECRSWQGGFGYGCQLAVYLKTCSNACDGLGMLIDSPIWLNNNVHYKSALQSLFLLRCFRCAILLDSLAVQRFMSIMDAAQVTSWTLNVLVSCQEERDWLV